MMIRYVESEVSKCYHFCRETVMSVKVQVGSPVGHESYGTNNMGNRVSDKTTSPSLIHERVRV